jgi:hypothetical protein
VAVLGRHRTWIQINFSGTCKVEATMEMEEQGERKEESTRRISFRKVVDDDNAVFFQNVETGETVWNMPKHGDLVL